MTGEAEFDEVFLTDVELPAEHLLGPLHGGWGVGMAVLTSERGHIGTAVIGLERRLEQLVAIADGGGGAADRGPNDLGPNERQQLAGLIARGQAYKAMALRQGPAASTAASLMKLGITEMMFDAAMLRGGLGGAAVPSTAREHLACWPHPEEGSPGARVRSSATSSANVCSGCRENPNRDRTAKMIATANDQPKNDREVRIVNRPVEDDTAASRAERSAAQADRAHRRRRARRRLRVPEPRAPPDRFLVLRVQHPYVDSAGDGGRARRRPRPAVHQLVAALPEPSQRNAEGRASPELDMNMQRVESSDGVSVAVHDLGGRGPALLISHATGFNAHTLPPDGGDPCRPVPLVRARLPWPRRHPGAVRLGGRLEAIRRRRVRPPPTQSLPTAG